MLRYVFVKISCMYALIPVVNGNLAKPPLLDIFTTEFWSVIVCQNDMEATLFFEVYTCM